MAVPSRSQKPDVPETCAISTDPIVSNPSGYEIPKRIRKHRDETLEKEKNPFRWIRCDLLKCPRQGG
jgi:hypothetical protein